MGRAAGGELRGATVTEREGGGRRGAGQAGLMRFRVLGPLEVETVQGWQPIGARKWRSLLAMLLLNAGQTVSVDTLTDAIWGEEPPAKAANLVSIYVLRLRRLIGDPEGHVLITRAPGYFIKVETGELDSARFEEMLNSGREALETDPEQAAVLLGEALALWRGDVLADVPPSAYVDAEIQRLGELRLNATELRIEADLACGRFAQVIPELRALLSGNQLRERSWLLLMQALEGDGRRAEALEVYAQAREAIAEQLGVDPSAELRRLHADLLAADDTPSPAARQSARSRSRQPRRKPQAPAQPEPAGSATPVSQASAKPAEDLSLGQGPGLPTGTVTVGAVPESVAARRETWLEIPRPAQLPADIGDFTGRAELVDHLCGMLSVREANSPGAVPVVVVAGSGGLGKTSLAVHAAHRLREEFQDGQLHIDLLGATPHPQAPADVLARFLRDLGVENSQVPSDLEERAAMYRTRLAGRRVLVLLDNARDAAQVRPLLPGSSSCAVIVTARNRMPDLASTRLVDLEVLDDDESLTLFTRVVGESRAAAEPDATAEVLVACAGLPLAIRICAARLAARSRWSIHTLAERLHARLLDELKTGDMAVRASFQVSFDSLPKTANPARAFRLLGLWQGAFISPEAAAALLDRSEDETAEALEILVDACLLESPAPDQYRFHDLLRVYAGELARTDETQADRDRALRRLFEWYLHTVDAAATAISPQRTRPPVPAIPADLHPLAFADADPALDWLESERGNIVAATRQAATTGAHTVAWLLPAAAAAFFNRRGYHNDSITTHQLALTSARRAGDLRGEGHVLNNLGMANSTLNMSAAIDYFEQALKVRRQVGDARGEAQTSSNLLYTYLQWGHFAEVVARYPEAMDYQRRSGVRHNEGVVLNNVAEAYLALGQVDEGIDCLQRAERIFDEFGDERGLGNVLQLLGDAYLAQGRADKGIDAYGRGVDLLHAVRDRPGEANALLRWGRACNSIGHHDQARSLLTQALAQFRVLGDTRQVAAAREQLAATPSANGELSSELSAILLRTDCDAGVDSAYQNTEKRGGGVGI
jgi:DNA-binding SARP family transcriptional activator